MTHEARANRWALLHQALIQDRLDDVQKMLVQHGLPAAPTDTLDSDTLAHRALTLLVGASHTPDINEPCCRTLPTHRTGPSLLFTTVLHWALEGSRPNLVNWLIEHGASVSTVDSQGHTPWDLVDQELRLRQLDRPSPFQHHARTVVTAASPVPQAPSIVLRVSAIPVTRVQRIDASTVEAFQTALVQREQALLTAIVVPSLVQPSCAKPSTQEHASTAPRRRL